MLLVKMIVFKTSHFTSNNFSFFFNTSMHIFKFGGASVKDAAAVRNVATILQQYKNQPLVIIVSAMGKMTNALETVVNAYMRGEGDPQQALQVVRDAHTSIATDLLGESHPIHDTLNDILVEIEWIIEETPSETYDYVYDQIVSIGEFLSTQIVAAFLNTQGLPTAWLDARNVIRTDNTYRDGNVDWADTEARMQRIVPPLVAKGFVLTQGFVGGTSENFTTTLGREGSDYTAAICAYCLNATDMTIWKDVPGILTADPRFFKNVTMLHNLSYREAIEMTYYGAQVIHPKTIKPIQNKNIPLWVRSFIDFSARGTLIDATDTEAYLPMIVVKKNQAVLHISTRDFSFVAEEHLRDIFALLAKHRLSANMMQNTAISFSVCLDNMPERIENLEKDLNVIFNIKKDNDLELITVRHFQDSTLTTVKQNKIVLLEEYLPNTAQMVVREVPILERIVI
jgi:aspartate kinase